MHALILFFYYARGDVDKPIATLTLGIESARTRAHPTAFCEEEATAKS